MSNGFVVALGVGTVFLGLICLMLVCMAVSWVCRRLDAKAAAAHTPAEAPMDAQSKAELVAAVTAVLADALGQEASAIRILSFRKL